MNLNVGSIADPDLASLLQQIEDNVMTGLNCHRVGQIQSFDAATQTASITITQNAQVGSKVYDFPLLVNVPVYVMTGGATGVITMPIAPGDTCLVAFHDRDLDNWATTGNTALPNTPRVHSLADGMAFVGFRNAANPVANYSPTAIEIRNLGSKIKVDAAIQAVSSLAGQVLVNANVQAQSANGGQVLVAANVNAESVNGGVLQLEDKIRLANDATDLRTVLELITTALYALNTAKTGGNVVGSIDAAVLGIQALLKTP